MTDPAVEALAAWMIENGFATGHGDTLDDLLQELAEQMIDRLWPTKKKPSRTP